MKPLLCLTLFLLLLTACAPVASQPMPLPAVDVPPVGADGAAPPAVATQEKIVEMATQTPEEATLPATAAAPTTDLNQPTSTSTSVALPKTLEELGLPVATYEDKVAGLALDYPANWEINALPDDVKQDSMAYTASLRSPHADRGPKQQEGIPPDMGAIDLTVINNGPKTLEQAVAERRAATTTNEAGLTIQTVAEEEWVLREGLLAHRFLYNLGKDPIGGYGDRDKMSTELVTIINGKMVLVSGMGDLSLFSAIVSSLRQIPPGQ